MNTLSDLLAKLAGTNNGYLFAPNRAELAIAAANPESVDIRAGQIHPKGIQPPHPATAKPFSRDLYEGDYIDFEAAILSRQSHRMI